MKRVISIFSLAFLLFVVGDAMAQNYGNGLPATDALGRKLPTAEEVGAPRKDKYVGLFYWTWHTNFADLDACIPSRVIEKNPNAAYNYEHPAWDNTPHTCFWGEPLFGFYRDTDKWVLRKHAEMLADAGVDVLFFDCTNGNYTWQESYQALCEVFAEARKDGVNTPQIAFMLAFGPMEGSREAIISIYKDLYKPAKYEELFFKWQGKPLIMAYPEMLADVEGDAEQTAINREVREYFTFRPGQPVYNVGPQRPDHWGWLEIYPQHGFAPKKENARIYERFRTACDVFFERKRNYYSGLKDQMEENLVLKTQICEQAEAIMTSDDWKTTGERLIELQRRWKEIGAVPRRQSDAVWKRFRAACDTFFERKSAHFSSVDSEHKENLSRKRALLEEMAAFDIAGVTFDAIKDFQRRWGEIGFVPLKQKEAIQKQYKEVVDKLFGALRGSERERNFDKFRNRISTLKQSGDKRLRFERERLFNKVKQLEADIATLENNIGFFAGSKNAESLIAEVRIKITKAKEEMADAIKKVQAIDAADKQQD